MPNLFTRPRASSRHSTAAIEPLETRRLLSFAGAVQYPVGTGQKDIVAADFNDDGHLDLATAASNTVSVRLGNGAGGFGDVSHVAAGAGVLSVATGDFDDDGNFDLAALRFDGEIAWMPVLRGLGDGTFLAPVNTIIWEEPLAMVSGDFNGDGRSDLVYSFTDPLNWESTIVAVCLSVGLGRFSLTFDRTYGLSGSDPVALAAGDLNGDGKLDVVSANDPAGTVSVLLGNGDGTLSYDPFRDFAAGPSPRAVAIGKLTGDQAPDLVVAGAGVNTLRGFGDGTFDAPVHHSANGTLHGRVAIADFNGDGKLDAIVTDTSTIRLMLGNGDGALTYAGAFAAGTSPSGLAVGDFNGDGLPDLAVSNAGSNNFSVLLNDTDIQPPIAGAGDFPYRLAPHRINIPFSEPVGPSLSILDITVTNLSNASAAAPAALGYDTATNTATFSFAGVLADGRYRATIPAANVTDLAGNPMADDFTFDFFVLAADADRDALVDIADLAILATHWQGTNATFDQGDFNYDGAVNVSDFAILAVNWQKSLPPPLASPARSPQNPHGTTARITPHQNLFSEHKLDDADSVAAPAR